VGTAAETGVERGTMWRVDSTVVDSPVHAPSEASLLLDGVRVMVRLLQAGQALPRAPVLDWHDHSRRGTKSSAYSRRIPWPVSLALDACGANFSPHLRLRKTAFLDGH